MNTNEKRCESCGASCQEKQRYCHVCGEPFPSVETPRPHRKRFSFPRPHLTVPSVKVFARNLVFLALSAVIFIFSFLPIVSYPMEFKENSDSEDIVSIDISAFDCVTFLADSFCFLDEVDLKESDLYDEIKDLSKDLSDVDFSDKSSFSSEEKNLLSSLTKTTFRLALRSEDVPVRPFFIVTTVLSLLYIVFAFTLFAISLWNLIALLLGKKSLYHVLIKCFCFSPLLALITFFTVDNAIRAMSFGDGMGQMAFPIGILITASVGILLAAVTKLFSTRSRVSFGKVGARIAVAAMSITLICMLAAPVANMNIDSVFADRAKKREVSVGVSAGSLWAFELSDEEMDDIKDELGNTASSKRAVIKSYIDALEIYTIKEMRSGKADSAVSTVANYSLFAYCGEASIFAVFVPYLLILAALAAAFIAWQSLVFLCVQQSPKVIAAHVAMHLFTVASLVLGIIYVVFINTRIFLSKLGDSFSASIGAGLILAIVFGVLTSVFAAIANLLPTYRCPEAPADDTPEIFGATIVNNSTETVETSGEAAF